MRPWLIGAGAACFVVGSLMGWRGRPYEDGRVRLWMLVVVAGVCLALMGLGVHSVYDND